MVDTGQSVLVIGVEPTMQDFSDPALPPGLDAGKVRAALDAEQDQLRAAGYRADLLLIDTGETAAAVVVGLLREGAPDCIVISAGIRIVPRHFELFEMLVDTIHKHAPETRIAFNTGPDDSLDAARRRLGSPINHSQHSSQKD